MKGAHAADECRRFIDRMRDADLVEFMRGVGLTSRKQARELLRSEARRNPHGLLAVLKPKGSR